MEPFRFEERVSIIKKWLSGEKPGPLELRIWLTARCNLSCIFCPLGSTGTLDRPNKELTVKEWLPVIDCLGELGCQHVDIGGGEPFLRREDALVIMEQIKSKGMGGAITTNATLLKEEHIRRIVEMGWESIQISLDGATAVTHDTLRGSHGSHLKVLKTLKVFRKIRGEFKSPKTEVHLATVLTNHNYRELPQLVNTAIDNDCESFRITPMVEQFEECAQYQIKDGHKLELLSLLEECLLIARNAGLTTNIEGIQHNLRLALSQDKFNEMKSPGPVGEGTVGEEPHLNTPLVCFEPWFMLRIDPLGWINCCTSDTERRVNLRNIELEEVWYNGSLERIRNNMLKGMPVKACKFCCYPVYAENLQFTERLKKTYPHLLKDFRPTMMRRLS